MLKVTMSFEHDSTTASSGTVYPHNLPDLTAQYPILHCDDDAGIITLVKMMLERAGLTVIGAVDARDTVTICQKAPVSLVISDVMKPGMNGFDLLKYLRADPATQPIPFMFLSSETGQHWRQRGLDLGAEEYLGKPVYPAPLVKAVTAVLLKRGRWHVPPTYDPALTAALMASESRQARGSWHGKVWTARKTVKSV